MRIGYIRCSTIEQNEARQVKMMEAQQAERLFIDKASGKNTNRAAFQEMMDYVRAGDVVITESISRIARNTRDLLSIISDLTARHAAFVPELGADASVEAARGRQSRAGATPPLSWS